MMLWDVKLGAVVRCGGGEGGRGGRGGGGGGGRGEGVAHP